MVERKKFESTVGAKNKHFLQTFEATRRGSPQHWFCRVPVPEFPTAVARQQHWFYVFTTHVLRLPEFRQSCPQSSDPPYLGQWTACDIYSLDICYRYRYYTWISAKLSAKQRSFVSWAVNSVWYIFPRHVLLYLNLCKAVRKAAILRILGSEQGVVNIP